MFFRRIVSLILTLTFVVGVSVFHGSASPATAQEDPVIKCDNQALCKSALKFLAKKGFDLEAAYKGEGDLDFQALGELAFGLKGKNAQTVSYLATSFVESALTEAGVDQADWQDFFAAVSAKDSEALSELVAGAGITDELTSIQLEKRLLNAVPLNLKAGGLKTAAKFKGIKDQLKAAGVPDEELEQWVTIYWSDPEAFDLWLIELGLTPEEFWALIEEYLVEYYLLIGFDEAEIEAYFVEVPADDYDDEYFLFDEYYEDYADEYGDEYAAEDYSGEEYVAEDYSGAEYAAEDYSGEEYAGDGGAEYTDGGGEEYVGGGDSGGGEEYAGGGEEGGDY